MDDRQLLRHYIHECNQNHTEIQMQQRFCSSGINNTNRIERIVIYIIKILINIDPEETVGIMMRLVSKQSFYH